MSPKATGYFFVTIGVAFFAIAAVGKQVAFHTIGAPFIVSAPSVL